MTTGGYDAAQAQRDQDDLERWQFAAEIVEVILATSNEWSARIGIFGKWGEGKTTVLRFAKEMLTQKQNVVFFFSPWAVQNWNDLWEEFGERLIDALDEAKVTVELPWTKKLKSIKKLLDAKGVTQIVELGAGLMGKDKVASNAFGLVSRWLRYDGEQIKKIRKQLGDRRVIVLIDDLDRCSQELLPQLLLSLRELLDLPGFTFLLAFDDEIVGRMLEGKNPAWQHGADFLDKILDFRFHLPPISERQQLQFTSRAMERFCPFVPQEPVKELRDLLPSNPRKLKALIRSLVALKPHLARHAPDEINWVDMWLAQMVRIESYPFFERLLEGDTLDRETGILYKLLSEDSDRKSETKNQSIKRLIESSGVENPATEERLIKLVEAIRARATSNFKYVCELAIRPDAVTWKEFRSIYSIWAADSRASVLNHWVTQHAEERSISVEDVKVELFDSMLRQRATFLDEASESQSLKEHDQIMTQVRSLWHMLEQFLLELNNLDRLRFEKLLHQAGHWIGFQTNETDQTMRVEERALILRIVDSVSGEQAAELFETLSPQGFIPDVGEGAPARAALRRDCLDIIKPKVAREAIAFLGQVRGIQRVSEPGKFTSVKYCLFHPLSPVWKPPLFEQLIRTIEQSREDHNIYQNVREYLDLLVHGLQYGIDSIRPGDIKELLSVEQFVELLWKAATSRNIQYRMQILLVRARMHLIRNGVSETLLPLTAELEKRLKEEEAQLRSQAAQAAEGDH